MAVAEDHTLVLTSLKYPALPSRSASGLELNTLESTIVRHPTYSEQKSESERELSSLFDMAQREVMKSMVAKNVIPLYVFAKKYAAADLAAYCYSFIESNLDFILMRSKPQDMERLLAEEWLSVQMAK